MGRYIREKDGRLASINALERGFEQLKSAGSPLAQRILALLAERPRYSHDLARTLKVHEQKIYYHIRKLEQSGLIEMERREEISGASAKYYRVTAPAFTVLLAVPRATGTISATPSAHKAFLEPFITDGEADFLIVIGSPLAHGPGMVQARDGGYAIDLALFLGSHLSGSAPPVVKLDTEFRKEDWRHNLIIIGGPIVNTAAAKVQDTLPIRFATDGKTITSRLSGERYENDQIGLIVKAKNPCAQEKTARKRGRKTSEKMILYLAGRRQAGTKAAILAFLTRFDELIAGNTHDHTVAARVVEGRDLDSDGVVDDVKFRE